MRDILSIYLDRIEHLEERLAEARAEIERIKTYGKKVQQGFIKACDDHDKYKRLCEGMWDVLDRIAVYENPWKGHPHQNTCERLQELAKESLAAYEEAVK